MVETIQKIRTKISKLLIRISELENSLESAHQNHDDFKKDLALKIIDKKDDIVKRINSDISDESDVSGKGLLEQLKLLDGILEQMEVKPLAAPLDKLADFIKIVGTVKDDTKRNGLVTEVVKIGYLKDDDLLRPTHVIVVKND